MREEEEANLALGCNCRMCRESRERRERRAQARVAEQGPIARLEAHLSELAVEPLTNWTVTWDSLPISPIYNEPITLNPVDTLDNQPASVYPEYNEPIPVSVKPIKLSKQEGELLAQSLTVLLCNGATYKDSIFGRSTIGSKKFPTWRCRKDRCGRMGSNKVTFNHNKDRFYLTCECGSTITEVFYSNERWCT